MNNYGYIYKTTNTKDGRVYVGQRKGTFDKNYLGSGLHIKNAIKGNGKGIFKVELICYLPDAKQLNEFEAHVIEKYREIIGREKMYNIASGGFVLGLPLSEETKAKIKEARKRQIFTPETRLRMSIARKGKIITQEQREKLRASNIGKKHNFTEQALKNISKSSKARMMGNTNRRGSTQSEEAKNKIRKAMSMRRLTPEHKRKIGLATRKRYENIKAIT